MADLTSPYCFTTDFSSCSDSSYCGPVPVVFIPQQVLRAPIKVVQVAKIAGRCGPDSELPIKSVLAACLQAILV